MSPERGDDDVVDELQRVDDDCELWLHQDEDFNLVRPVSEHPDDAFAAEEPRGRLNVVLEPGLKLVAKLRPLGEESAAAFERRLELTDQDRGVGDDPGASRRSLGPAIGPVRPGRARVVVFRLFVEEVDHQAIDPPGLGSRLVLGNLGNLMREPGPLMEVGAVELPGDRHELLGQVIAKVPEWSQLPLPGQTSMLIFARRLREARRWSWPKGHV